MISVDFITQLFLWVDDKLKKQHRNQKHTQANLYPSGNEGSQSKKKGEEREKVKEGKKARSENLAL